MTAIGSKRPWSRNSRGEGRVYSEIVLGQMPRLLSYIDRNSDSETFGCCDRNFWHYKFIDFPSARLQEFCLTLALLYINKYPDNQYYGKGEILNLSIAAMNFWTEIQNRDGSFNEWYPNEHSFVATAFTSYAISEAFLLLGNLIPPEKRERIKMGLVKSGNFLVKRDEKVSNQQACAASALYNIFLITRDERYAENCRKKIKTLLKEQSREGWFPEYRGFDAGYFSVLINFLAKYAKKSKDKNLIKKLDPSLEFLKYFIHPDFSVGGEYGSRNTEYLLPHGLEILSEKNRNALLIKKALLENLKRYGSRFDDRYLLNSSYSFLQAYDDFCSKEVALDLPFNQEFDRYFPDAGLYIYSSRDIYSITGLRKGGVLRIFDKNGGEKILDDSGVHGVLDNGDRISTQFLDSGYRINAGKNSASVSGNLHLISYRTLSPLSGISLRVLQLLVGNSYRISNFIRWVLRRELILKSRKAPIRFRREFSFQKKSVRIDDTISIQGKQSVKGLILGGKFSIGYTPSSRLFYHLSDSGGYELSAKELGDLNDKKVIKVSRRIP